MGTHYTSLIPRLSLTPTKIKTLLFLSGRGENLGTRLYTGTSLVVCDSSLTISSAWHDGGCVQVVLGSSGCGNS